MTAQGASWPTGWLLTLALVVVLMLWALGAQRRLQGLRRELGRAWAQLESAYTQRGQAVAALTGALRQHWPHEHATLDALLVASTQVQDASEALARNPAHAPRAASLMEADTDFAGQSSRVYGLLQYRTDLLAQAEVAAPYAQMQQAQSAVTFGRQLFNQAAQQYNRALLQMPTRLLILLLRYRPAGQL